MEQKIIVKRELEVKVEYTAEEIKKYIADHVEELKKAVDDPTDPESVAEWLSREINLTSDNVSIEDDRVKYIATVKDENA